MATLSASIHVPPAAAASAFNIRFEGEESGGRPLCWVVTVGLREAWQGWVLGGRNADLLRLEKRPWLDCPLDPQRLLFGAGEATVLVPISDMKIKT